MALIKRKKQVVNLYQEERPVSRIYYKNKLVWIYKFPEDNPIIDIILSCYYNGYWMDEYPWTDDTPWTD